MYRTPNTTLIGDVLVRFSKSGDFELTVSKGPGVTLLSLRQDAIVRRSKRRVRATAAGRGLWNKRRNNCAAGLVYETNSFTSSPPDKIDGRCDTSPVTKRSCSGFD
jgi:hypothetical protein